MKKLKLTGIIGVGILVLATSCKKEDLSTNSLYVPASTDVTANATLAELQSGHTLYVGRCGACHGLYSPDDFSSAQWTSILSSMAPKAGLSSSEKTLVYKYVSRGQ